MMTQGILVKANRKQSKYGGHYYDCKVKCEDRDRTLMADPKMANWSNWEEIVQTIQKDIMRGRGIALGNLKVLERKGELLNDKLDADVVPELIDIIKVEDVE